MGALMLVHGLAHGVLVGHSYAGLVISKAAAERPDVQHLVYVAAMLVDGGDVYLKRMREFPAAPINDEVELTADGNLVVRPETAVGCFYNECDKGEAADAARRLRPSAAACLSVSTGAEPWRAIPSTHVLCLRDRAIHPDLQSWMSARAGEVVTLDTDHSPFMSSAEQFADLLDGIAARRTPVQPPETAGLMDTIEPAGLMRGSEFTGTA